MVPAWDAIVIGSGIGGMSAAGLLAKVGGMKVLVLEKHSERGGQTHMFRRDGAAWDVGLHYVGELDKGSIIRTVIDFLSGGALEWNKMTDEFERFLYPGLNFAVPSDPARYLQRLVERFPDEAPAIRTYFSDLRAVAAWHVLGIQAAVSAAAVGVPFRPMAPARRGQGDPDDRGAPAPPFPLAGTQSLARLAMGRLRLAAKPKRVRAARPRGRQLSQGRLVPEGRRRAHRAHV